MSTITYNRSLETMLSTCLDTYSKDPVNLFLDGGEKFLGAAASKGRIFVVNDSASIRHPHIYDHASSGSSYYEPDNLGVAAGTAVSLGGGTLKADATDCCHRLSMTCMQLPVTSTSRSLSLLATSSTTFQT